ncbi:MAG: GNAT family N-acetyltransferase [Gaiellaceae bacterium]
MVSQLRRFNRVVTQRMGALDEHYLARGRPLGEARLLWEIGSEGCDVRSLRTRLELDSGYLSRLLRRLEADGLVIVEPDERDRRVRVARLSAAGLAERDELDRGADRLAQGVLEGLTARQRERLVRAMADVERLMTASMVEIRQLDPEHPLARHCLREYSAELDRRFPGGFDVNQSITADPADMRPPNGLLLVAMLRSEPVGCGALLFHEGEPPYLKRMWVAEHVRGLGLGRRLLEEFEARAAETGSPTVHLETNRTLTEAIAMYRSAGYVEVEPFNDEHYADHWFEKQL